MFSIETFHNNYADSSLSNVLSNSNLKAKKSYIGLNYGFELSLRVYVLVNCIEIIHIFYNRTNVHKKIWYWKLKYRSSLLFNFALYLTSLTFLDSSVTDKILVSMMSLFQEYISNIALVVLGKRKNQLKTDESQRLSLTALFHLINCGRYFLNRLLSKKILEVNSI